MTASYDRIGTTYASTRRPDPRIQAAIWDALGDAETVVNVGAGSGSYEPPQTVLAVEPSAVMIAQRPAGSAPAARSGGYLAWPVNGVITQYMWAGHTGVDIAAPYGTGLAASVAGVISQNGWVAVGGLHICIQSGSLEECYYHLSAAYLPVGTPVTAGQIVAAIGLTGVTTGPHVHWETKVNGQLVNPLTVQP